MDTNDSILTREEIESNSKAGENGSIYRIVKDDYYFAFRQPRRGIEVARIGFMETDTIDIIPPPSSSSSPSQDDNQLYFCIITDRFVVQSKHNIRLKNIRFIDRSISVITQQEFDNNYHHFVSFPAKIFTNDDTNESIVYPCHVMKRDGVPSNYIKNKEYFQLPDLPITPSSVI